MARGTFGPSSYVTALGPTASSMDKRSSGVTFGCDEAASSSKRQPCLRAMPRVRFPPLEQRGEPTGEGGDRPCSSIDVKVGWQAALHPDKKSLRCKHRPQRRLRQSISRRISYCFTLSECDITCVPWG